MQNTQNIWNISLKKLKKLNFFFEKCCKYKKLIYGILMIKTFL